MRKKPGAGPASSSARGASSYRRPCEQHETDPRGLLRAVGPGVVGAALDEHIAGLISVSPLSITAQISPSRMIA